MGDVELFRDKLYGVIDKGNIDEIIEVSKELDDEIIRYINETPDIFKK
jgi:hypothetical protein